MESPNLFFFLCFFLFSLLTGNQYVQGSSHHHHQSHQLQRGLYGFEPKKLFVFGDSYADTGNTRKSNTSAWKVPYGITFPGKPAGRFSSGRVFTDYLDLCDFEGIGNRSSPFTTPDDFLTQMKIYAKIDSNEKMDSISGQSSLIDRV